MLRKEHSILADVFGIELGKAGDHASSVPNPKPEVDPPDPPDPSEGRKTEEGGAASVPRATEGTSEDRATTRELQAARAVVRSAVIDAAKARGVKRPAAFAQLVDLSGVPVVEDEPDEHAVQAAVHHTLQQYPELGARTSTYGQSPARYTLNGLGG